MTLRKVLTLAIWLFTSLVLIGALGWIWPSTIMRQQNDELMRDLESVQLSSTLQVSLFKYRYHDRLWISTGKDEQFELRQRAEGELWATFSELRENMAGTPTVERLSTLQDDVSAYLRTLEAAHARFDQDVASAHAVAEPLFQTVQVALDALASEVRANAAASQTRSRALDHQTNIAGGILSAAALLLSGLLTRLLWRKLYHPVVQMRAEMDRYSRGDRSSRCTVAGPLELTEIASTFNTLADRLEAQRTARLRFIAAVAHDLRNPLASMRLYTQMVGRGRPLPGEERLYKAFEVMDRQVERLNRMTTDLLDATRIEAGELELHLETVDVAQVAQEVVSLLAENAPKHELVLEGADSLEVPGDETRLYQVLMNLVSNGVKYSPQGGVVTVRLGRSGDEGSITVSDEGVGIAPTELDRIFEPFHRSGGLKDNIPGAGLGLSVTRRIVEAHGGRLEVRSTPGQGSSFTVRLPAMRKATLPPAERGTLVQPAPGTRH